MINNPISSVFVFICVYSHLLMETALSSDHDNKGELKTMIDLEIIFHLSFHLKSFTFL